jgi:hypothetical protein
MVTRFVPEDIQTRNADYFPRTTPFGDITVYPDINNGTVIVWKLNEKWSEYLPDDTVLFLEYSETIRTPQDQSNWIYVWSGFPTNTIVDSEKRLYGQRHTGNYRLRLVSKKAGKEWISHTVGTYGKLPFTLWRLMLKVIRAENRTAQTYEGTPGYLLKRKWMGARCTNCIDWATDDIKTANCPYCYDTGFIGGYYRPPIPYTVIVEQKTLNDVVDGQHRGAVNDITVTGRMLALAGPVTYDVWVDNLTGERYIIGGLVTTVHIQGIPVVYTATLDKIPFSYPIYDWKIN